MKERHISVTNLVDVKTAGTNDYEWHCQFLADVGADGYLWTPTIAPGDGNRTAGLELARERKILGVHESWVDMTTKEALALARTRALGATAVVAEIAYSKFFPQLDDRSRQLELVQNSRLWSLAGQALIVQPKGQQLDNRESRRSRYDVVPQDDPFPQVIFQPTIEHMRQGMNIDPFAMDADEIVAAFKHFVVEKRYGNRENYLEGRRSLAIDTHHLTVRRNGEVLPEDKRLELVHGLAAAHLVHEVQLGFQPAFAASKEEAQEISDQLKMHLQEDTPLTATPQGRIVAAVYDGWNNGMEELDGKGQRWQRATVEVRRSALKAAGAKDHRQALRTLSETLRGN